jgi:hypothetical protein
MNAIQGVCADCSEGGARTPTRRPATARCRRRGDRSVAAVVGAEGFDVRAAAWSNEASTAAIALSATAGALTLDG